MEENSRGGGEFSGSGGVVFGFDADEDAEGGCGEGEDYVFESGGYLCFVCVRVRGGGQGFWVIFFLLCMST